VAEYGCEGADLVWGYSEVLEWEKPVASVCHGIEILAAARVLEGRIATTVAKCKLDIESFGGEYVDREVVVSGNLVTARTWHDNPAWMREYVRLLDTARG